MARLSPNSPGAFATVCFLPMRATSILARRWRRCLRRFEELGGEARFGVDAADLRPGDRRIVDCRGWAARDALPELRGVRGEMLVLHAPDVKITRCIRFLHPRIPLYVVPRGDGRYMVGATMIESADASPVSARSAIELLSAAYALHPGFGEARILEMRADVRPSFPDNMPRVIERGGRLYVNGFYRHGFLLAPAMRGAGWLPQLYRLLKTWLDFSSGDGQSS